MNRIGILVTSIVLLTCFLTSCAHNVTSKLPRVFEREYLNQQTSTQPIDLSSGGECPGTRTMNVVSKDTRTDPYEVYSSSRSYTITPSEYTRLVARYMEEKLRESNVQVDEESGTEIHVWMEEVYASGAWTFGCDVRLKVTIPEIGYTRVYAGHEGGAIIMNVVGYATNLAVVEFLKDPEVQKYIQCR